MNLSEIQVKKATSALYEYIQKSAKKTLLETPEVIQLQMVFKKIPHTKKKVCKIILPTPLVEETSDVCLFVKDLNVNDRDYEPTIEHYKELIDKAGIKNFVKIIPLKSLKIDYKAFEAKRNLSNGYDFYLADDCIVRLLPALLGKNFIARNRFPIQVNLKAKNLAKEFDRALTTTLCVISGRGSSCHLNIAHSALTEEQTVTNLMAAVNRLSEFVDGGYKNIRSLVIKTKTSPALPVYMSFESADKVELPTKPAKTIALEPEEVTTVTSGKVLVTPFGSVKIVSGDKVKEEIGKKTKKKDGKRGSKLTKSEDSKSKKARTVV